jgi:hypothetical protein
MTYEWWRQSTYRAVSMEWARGFARWLRDQGWSVGIIVDLGGGTVHIPAIRETGTR